MKAKVIAQILSIFADAVTEYSECYHIQFTPSDLKGFSIVTHNNISTVLIQFTAPMWFDTDLNDLKIALSDFMLFVVLPQSQIPYLDLGYKKVEPIFLKMITRKNEDKVRAEIIYIADKHAYDYVSKFEQERVVDLI